MWPLPGLRLPPQLRPSLELPVPHRLNGRDLNGALVNSLLRASRKDATYRDCACTLVTHLPLQAHIAEVASSCIQGHRCENGNVPLGHRNY